MASRAAAGVLCIDRGGHGRAAAAAARAGGDGRGARRPQRLDARGCRSATARGDPAAARGHVARRSTRGGDLRPGRVAGAGPGGRDAGGLQAAGRRGRLEPRGRAAAGADADPSRRRGADPAALRRALHRPRPPARGRPRRGPRRRRRPPRTQPPRRPRPRSHPRRRALDGRARRVVHDHRLGQRADRPGGRLRVITRRHDARQRPTLAARRPLAPHLPRHRPAPHPREFRRRSCK